MIDILYETYEKWWGKNLVILPIIFGLIWIFFGTLAVIFGDVKFLQMLVFIVSGQFYICGLVTWGVLCAFMHFFGGQKPEEKHIRGAKLGDLQSVIRKTKKQPFDLTLGHVPIPRAIETRGIAMIGTPGAGKSVAISELLNGARQRKNRAVVFDIGGQFIEKFYRPDKDFILNPMDSRSVNWSIFAEIGNPNFDCDRLAKSLVPDVEGKGKEWNLFSQQTIAAIIKRMWEKGERTNGDFLKYLSISSVSELRGLVEGTPAARILSPESKGMASSVLGILGAYASCLSVLDKNANEKSFSLKKWTAETDSDSWLFFSVRDDQAALLNPLISIWIDCVASALLSMDEDFNRRLFFGLDELASLPRIQNVKSLFEKGRKKGAVNIVGIQTTSQLFSTYGAEDGQTILNCLGTWNAFRSPDYQTAEYLSKTFGEAETLRVRESKGNNDDNENNWSENVETSPIILPSQIAKIPDLHGFTKLSGDFPVVYNSWQYKEYPKIAKTFEIS